MTLKVLALVVEQLQHVYIEFCTVKNVVSKGGILTPFG